MAYSSRSADSRDLYDSLVMFSALSISFFVFLAFYFTASEL